MPAPPSPGLAAKHVRNQGLGKHAPLLGMLLKIVCKYKDLLAGDAAPKA